MPVDQPRTRVDAVEVRFADASDLLEVAPLFLGYRAFYGVSSTAPECEAFLRARLSQGESVIFVAEAKAPVAGLCGFAQLYPSWSSLSGGRVWILNDLFVTPDCRGLGVGRALLRRVAEHGRTTGAASIVLSTQRANTGAKALYESEGYRLDREFDYYELTLQPSRAPA